MFNNFKNRFIPSIPAFTLAEVLITLGIIGVVAALTLPALITSNIEKARIANLQKIYSQMQNAWNMAVYENGSATNWNFAQTKTDEKNDKGQYILNNDGRLKFMELISPYFKKANVDDIKYEGSYSLDGREVVSSGETDDGATGGYIITADGFKLTVGWIQEPTNKLIADFWVNLPNEKKSIIGVTKFHFMVDKNKGFLPDGSTQSSFIYSCNVKNKSLGTSINGRSCTAWVLRVGNMDYLRCNNLNFNSKRKCN